MIFLAGYFARKFLRLFQVLKILTRITPCNTDTSRISATAEVTLRGSLASPQALATCRTWWNYLAEFLDARVAVMQPEEAHADLSRVDTQRKFLNGKNFTLELPLEWTLYGDEFYLDKEQLDSIAD